MGFENINLWFAKDDNDITVLAKDITKDIKHNNYKCPICGSSVIPRTGEIMSWHFAHRDASKCSTESFIHFWVKHELLKIGDTFKVKINNEVKEYTCKELLIEQKYETYYGVYKPDLTIITDNNETLYIEVAQTNKKKIKDFIKMWNELNNTVIEITTGEVSDGNKIECMNAIWYDGYEYHEQLKELREVGNKEKEKYKFTKEQIDKIDWLIDDIVKYNNHMIEIEQLSDEIQSIEDEDSRKLVCNIVRNKKCGTVLEDYVKYNKNRVENECNKIFSKNFKFYITIHNTIPNILYDMKLKVKYCDISIVENYITLDDVINNLYRIKGHGKINELIYLDNKFANDKISMVSKKIIKVIFEDSSCCKFYLETLSFSSIDNFIRDFKEEDFYRKLEYMELDYVKEYKKYYTGVFILYSDGSEVWYDFCKNSKINIIKNIKEHNNCIDSYLNKLKQIKNYIESNSNIYTATIDFEKIKEISITNKDNNSINVSVNSFNMNCEVNEYLNELFKNNKVDIIRNKIDTQDFDLFLCKIDTYGDLRISLGIKTFDSWNYSKDKRNKISHNKNLYYTNRHITNIKIAKDYVSNYDVNIISDKVNEIINIRNEMYNNNIIFSSKEIELYFGRKFIFNKIMKNINEIKDYSFIKSDNIVNIYNREFCFNKKMYTIPISFNNIKDIESRKRYIKNIINNSFIKKQNSNKLRDMLKLTFKYYSDTSNISNIDFDYIKMNGYYEINITKENFNKTILIKYYKNSFFVTNTKTFIDSKNNLIEYIGEEIRKSIYKNE